MIRSATYAVAAIFSLTVVYSLSGFVINSKVLFDSSLLAIVIGPPCHLLVIDMLHERQLNNEIESIIKKLEGGE